MLKPKNILFYDGDCAFCSYWVSKTRQWDPSGKFLFAPASVFKIGSISQESILLLSPSMSLSHSEAIFEILKILFHDAFWTRLLRLLPKWLADWTYSLVAKNRKWFNRFSPECAYPSPVERERFILNSNDPRYQEFFNRIPAEWKSV